MRLMSEVGAYSVAFLPFHLSSQAAAKRKCYPHFKRNFACCFVEVLGYWLCFQSVEKIHTQGSLFPGVARAMELFCGWNTALLPAFQLAQDWCRFPMKRYLFHSVLSPSKEKELNCSKEILIPTAQVYFRANLYVMLDDP